MITRNKVLIIVVVALALILISVETTLLIQKMFDKESVSEDKITVTSQQNPVQPTPVPVQVVTPTVVEKPDVVEIISVKPHYISVDTTKRRCRNVERVVYVEQPSHNAVGVIVGGVAGGALGNALIHGNNQTVATIAGATAGALAGSAVQKNMNKPQQHVVYDRVCSNYPSSKKIQKGYEVTYSHNGEQNMVVVSNKPN